MSWHKLSGSERQRIKQIVTRSGRFSPKQLAKRAAYAGRRHRTGGGNDEQ